ncbi:MAG: DUF4337 domain-containing protein [Janthinobacterium lividum]
MEPEEISEFSKEMREAGEQSLTHVSLIISVLAVMVAMVTVLGHREHTEAVLAQARATDQWNEYQARHIRQTEVGLAADSLALLPNAAAPAVQLKLNEYQERQSRVQEQLKEDSREARAKEAEVTIAEKRAARFDLGEALLQIGVVLASITLLTRHRRYVAIALTLGLGGLLAAMSALLVH